MHKQKNNKISYIVGIDEAGRGPLAGPVAVGAVCVSVKAGKGILERAQDSKLLSEKVREEIFKEAKRYHAEGALTYTVSMVHAETIDTTGISGAIRTCIKRCLKRLDINPQETLVLLDGSLKAPDEFMHQQTIIKGDQKEKVISLASIMAKVTRDRWMKRIAKTHPEYGFEIHKGYGTKKHREHIQTYGRSAIHRVTFCKNII